MTRKLQTLIFAFLCFTGLVNAQTFSGTGGGIPDNNTQTCFSISVTGLPGNLNSSTGLQSVCINIDHSFDSDLIIQLRAPDGTIIPLSVNNGGAGDDYNGTCFTMTASTNIASGVAPFNGSYIPEGVFLGLNDGTHAGNGTWQLCIRDDFPGDVGSLLSWNITFGTAVTCSGSPASDFCASATSICSFNGYCGNTSASYTAGSTSSLDAIFCGSIENNSWLSFEATGTSASFTFTSYGCTDPLSGVQLQVYSTPDCSNFTAVSSCYEQDLGMGTFTVSATGLTAGNTYYVMIDGFAGNVCQYFITANSGISTITLNSSNGNTLCLGQSTVLSASASGATGYTWSSNPAGSYTNTSSITVSPTVNTVYTVNITGACNTGANASYSINVTSGTPPTATGTTICGNTSTTLTASGTGTLQWYTASSGGTLLQTGGSYTTPVLTSTTTYYVQATSGGCNSTRTPVTVTVNPAPAAPTAAGTSICPNNSVTLTATAPGGSYAWYDAASGGTLLQSAASYTTPSLSSTTTYYVQTTSGGCTSTRTPVTVTVNPLPAAPTAAGTSICPNNTATLTATAPGGTYQWYTASSGGALLQTGGTFTTPSLASTTTYYVQTTDGNGCVSARTPVTVTVNPVPVAPTAASTSICNGNTATLTATAPGGTYQWYNAASGGVLLQTGASYTTPNLSSTTSYYVQSTNAFGCTGPRTAVTVTVNPLPVAPTAASTSICSGNTATLTATAPGGTYQWYDASSGGTLLQTGNSYTTPVLTSTTTYYVQSTDGNNCTGPRSAVVVTVNPQANPAFSYSQGTYCQSGSNPTPTITGTAGGTFSSTAGLNINSSTGAINLAGSTTGSYTVTYNTGGTCPNSSTQNITITTAPAATFSYTGPYCTNGIDPSPSFPAGSSAGTFSSTAGLVFISTGTGQIDLSASTPGTYTVNNNIAASGGCPASNASNSITINPLPAANAGTNQTTCQGQSVSIGSSPTGGNTYSWSSSPAGFTSTSSNPSVTPASTTVYTLTEVITGTGCSASNTVQVTVTPNPVAPTAAGQTICEGATATLTATAPGGTYQWYNAASGGTLLNTGASFTTPVLNSSTTYYVQATSGSCTGPRTAVNVTVETSPVANAGAGSNICSGSSVSLNGSGGSSYSWSPSASLNNANVNNPIASPSTTTTYTLTVSSVNNCTDTALVVVNVNANPTATITGVTSMCSGSNAVLVGNTSAAGSGTINSYQWQVSSTDLPGETNDSLIVSSVGAYTLIVTNTNGCSDTSAVTNVNVNTNPTAVITGSGPICQGDSVQLSGTGSTPGSGAISNYEWLLNNSPIATASTVYASSSGNYTLVVMDNNSCSDTSSAVNITVNPLPDASFTGLSASYCENATAVILSPATAGGAFNGTGVSGNVFDPAAAGPGGPYAVEYVVTDGNGCTDSSTVNVNVNAQPDPTFSGLDPVYCLNAVADTLVPVVAGGTFNGVGMIGNIFDPSVAGAGGPYAVEYVITDANGCSDSITVQVTVNPLPDPRFSGLAAQYCAGSSMVTLSPTTAGGIFSGTGISGSTFDPVTAGVGGPYTIIYTVTDANSCTNADTQQVVVNPLPDPSFTGLGASYCMNADTVDLVPVTTGGSFNGAGIIGSQFIPSLAGAAGTYSIEYVITNANGCSDSLSQQVILNSLPDPSFSGLMPSYCADAGSVNLNPVTTGGTFSGTGVAGSNFDPAIAGVGGPYTIQHLIIDANGCRDSITQQVSVLALPDAGFTGLSSGYCPDAVAVTLTPNTSGTVFSGPGVSGNSFDPALAGSGGPYTISSQVTDVNGCANSSSQQVTVFSAPLIDRTQLDIDSATCGAANGSISGIVAGGTNPMTFTWINSSSDTISSGSTSTLSAVPNGVYTLYVTDANGCMSITGPDTIFMKAGVIAAFTASVDTGEAPLWVTFTNASVGATVYNWDFGTEAQSSALTNPGNLFKEKGSYTVQLIASTPEGCSDTAEVVIVVTEDTELIFPNVFSPNNDGSNDVFQFSASGLSQFHCTIFNRWGERIYEWNTINSGWDGKTLSGSDAVNGTYFFQMTAAAKDGQLFKKEGTVTLVR